MANWIEIYEFPGFFVVLIDMDNTSICPEVRGLVLGEVAHFLLQN